MCPWLAPWVHVFGGVMSYCDAPRPGHTSPVRQDHFGSDPCGRAPFHYAFQVPPPIRCCPRASSGVYPAWTAPVVRVHVCHRVAINVPFAILLCCTRSARVPARKTRTCRTGHADTLACWAVTGHACSRWHTLPVPIARRNNCCTAPLGEDHSLRLQRQAVRRPDIRRRRHLRAFDIYGRASRFMHVLSSRVSLYKPRLLPPSSSRHACGNSTCVVVDACRLASRHDCMF
mmetsp:Transcript_46394/g.116036  ORF Transcript_46394/g.116036 Transcript_46394/m.116036 type:complete len:230 (-) Transcript_46394:77-766(-)